MKLFENPKYTSQSGIWFDHFNQALTNTGNNCSWDPVSMLSMVSLHYACSELTLIKEIKKNPWMSRISNNQLILHSPPRHDQYASFPQKIGTTLFELLVEELTNACKNYKKVYLLLSGGMDSRIVACAMAEIIKRGYLSLDVTTITWGLYESMDARLAELVSKELGFNWFNIELNPDIILKNIQISGRDLGGMTNAYHLHGMSWFENVPKDVLVIAGSYGDGIGRAEYSGRHVLDLQFLKPFNRYRLINEDYFPYLKKELTIELNLFKSRFTGQRKYEICELEQQGQYMRNHIAYSMSTINKYCNVYQAFTDPKLYSYVWSIHPSFRTNRVYAELISGVNKNIAHLPWAKTGKSITGYTTNLEKKYSKRFNKYREWITDELYSTINPMIDFTMLEKMQLFDLSSVQRLSKDIKDGINNYHAYNLYLWLVGVSVFNEYARQSGIDIKFPAFLNETKGKNIKSSVHSNHLIHSVSNDNRRFPFIKKKSGQIRKFLKLVYYLIVIKPKSHFWA